MIRGRNYNAQCPESRHEWINIPLKTDKRTDRKTNILLRLTSEELKTIDLKEIKKRLRKENSEDVWYSIVKKFEK